MPHPSTHPSTYAFDLLCQLNQYEIKLSLLQSEVSNPPQNSSPNWLDGKQQDMRMCETFIATLKGVLK